MLGKQGWKLLNDSSSLLTRILKAKYSLEGISRMQILVIIQALHGGAFGVPKTLSLWVIDGRLTMVPKLMFGHHHGFTLSLHLNCLPPLHPICIL